MLNRSNMNISPNSSLMQRTLDLQYENKKRASSLKWSVINGVLFVVFVYDLSCKCPGYTSAFHYAEYALALLLGTKSSPSNRSMDTSELSISLSPRGWRNPEAGSRSASASPPEPLSYSRIDSNADKFIADSSSLSDYLKSYEERSFLESTLNTSGSPPVPVPHYHLASIDTGVCGAVAPEHEDCRLRIAGGGTAVSGSVPRPEIHPRSRRMPQQLQMERRRADHDDSKPTGREIVPTFGYVLGRAAAGRRGGAGLLHGARVQRGRAARARTRSPCTGSALDRRTTCWRGDDTIEVSC
ncbi:hypothetical protein MSG28_000156 [Choristoneura fumiferana]|uniref:Uncharacterized protein n=1 Tax=Choristoneura fumiferana TaxID=7141 RepID=A0ACC0JZI5_CHOFU|nr:hypothetical protein MSG28_000156 [Choristoneura fumiferana]